MNGLEAPQDPSHDPEQTRGATSVDTRTPKQECGAINDCEFPYFRFRPSGGGREELTRRRGSLGVVDQLVLGRYWLRWNR